MQVLSEQNFLIHSKIQSNNQEKISTYPETCKTMDEPELIRQISLIIKRETNLGVQEMNVFLENGKWVLTGYCQTFYTKQLVQEAVLKVIGDVDLINRIYVA
ncbi:MAG: hypothetical protein LBQ50_04125 [Planctomycetaceae bacterium]|jgi:hypothetical protein|nr:hypothetical protein [Planctomycetaceae bacterium]